VREYADWIFCLVRTDPAAKKQVGISFILVDMKSRGLTVRPIITIDGRHEVNEVFFDNVEVPAENLVGEENRGWDYAKFLLANERLGIARIGLSKERIARVRRLASRAPTGSGTVWDSVTFRDGGSKFRRK
jgi:alkylation response protein AidB-like acyl-CoA dehydrogenase